MMKLRKLKEIPRNEPLLTPEKTAKIFEELRAEGLTVSAIGINRETGEVWVNGELASEDLKHRVLRKLGVEP